jgi:WD40 repeat protein
VLKQCLNTGPLLCQLFPQQQQVNINSFSPDGRLIASASFDKSIKLWDSNGK